MTATPRPWHKVNLHDIIIIRAGGGDTLTYVAEVRLRGVPHGEGPSNGALILRAVNSFDAMKEALEKVDRWITAHPHKATLAQSVKDEIKAALALAKGEIKS